MATVAWRNEKFAGQKCIQDCRHGILFGGNECLARNCKVHGAGALVSYCAQVECCLFDTCMSTLQRQFC